MNAGTDNAAEDADEIAILNADDRDADRQQHVKPGPLDVWAPQRVSGERVAEIKDETGRDGNWYQAGEIEISYRNCAESQRCCDAAHACPARILQQAAGPVLQPGGETSKGCGKQAA